MSAAEIIELIKKLPPEERAAVLSFVRKGKSADEAAPKLRYISNEKFAEVAPKVFEKHHDLLRRLSQ